MTVPDPHEVPTTATPPQPSGRGRLERPREDRLLGGVCAGLARHLGVDVTLVRIAAIVLTFIGGAGLVAYLVALVIVPEEGAEQPLAFSGRLDADARMPYMLTGLVLAAIAVGAGPLPWGWWDGGGWVLVAVAGGALVWLALRRDGRATASGDGPGAPSGPLAPGEPVAPATSATHVTEAVRPAAPDADDGEPCDRTTDAVTAAMPTTAPSPTLEAGAAEPTRRRGTARIAAGALLLCFGIVGLLATTIDDLSGQTAIAIGVLACGGVALTAAPFGGVRLVVAVGFVLASVGGLAAATDLELRGGFGERTEEPATIASLPDGPYRLAAGSLVIDLRRTAFPPGTTTVRARSGMGEIVVRAPRGVTVLARARAGLGEAVALGRSADGGSADVRARSPQSRPVRVIVDARVGLGRVEITQDGVRRGVG